MKRTSDLSPPLGYPGGPCHVVQRIHEEVRNPRLRDNLSEEVERNQDLSNAEAHKVYDLEAEPGTRRVFRKLLLTPHAQYRMDLRGVTVPAVRRALQNFLMKLNDWKSQQDYRYNRTTEELARGEPIRWEDPKLKLVIVFVGAGREQVRLITTFWQGIPDERAPGPGQCTILADYRAPAGDLSGYRTFVKFPDGDHAPDRTKERALPSPPWKRAPSQGRPDDLNTPGWSGQGPQEKSINKDLMRTKGKPGEESPPNDEPARTTPKRRSIEGFSPIKVRQRPKRRQRRQKGVQRLKSRRNYMKNRAKARSRSRRRYKRVRNQPAFKKQQKIRRKNPQRFKRRRANVLTAPDIAFVLGLGMTLGYVHNVSPMTGLVTYYLTDVSGNFAALRSMSVQEFLAGVSFMSEEDADAMFRLIDAELGVEAYGDMTEESLRSSMDFEGVDCDASTFGDICEQLTRKRELFDMTSAELERVEGYFVGEVVYDDIPQFPHEDDASGAADPYLLDPTDDDPIYGVVNLPEEYQQRQADFLYEKRPVEHEPGSWSDRAGPKPLWQEMHEERPRAEKEPEGQVIHAPGSAKVIPYNSDLVNNKAATRISEIQNRCRPELHEKAKGIPVKLRRVDSRNRIWFYEASGSSGNTYRVKIKVKAPANVTDPNKADVFITCSCPFWRWQGPEHWAKQRKYLYGKPRGTASRPVIRDPDDQHGACKHTLAVLNQVSQTYLMKPRRRASALPLAECVAFGHVRILHKDALHRVVARYCERRGDAHAHL